MRRERRMKKNYYRSILTVMMTGMMSISAFAGWEGSADTSYQYKFESGAYARDQVITVDGANYGFDQNADMVKGWMKQKNGDWYYFSPENGIQLYGWQKIGESWYYLNSANQGAAQIGMFAQGAKRYYFDETGAMKTGSFEYDGFTYFAEVDGSLRRNTIQTENGISIRYDEDGKEWYKNTENVVNGKGGGETWLPLLAGSALNAQRSSIQESNKDIIKEKKEDLYKEYKEKVRNVKYTKRAARETTWINKVKKRLGELYVSEQEINDYIYEVKNGQYSSEDEEETSSYEYDDYDDYDYAYDE